MEHSSSLSLLLDVGLENPIVSAEDKDKDKDGNSALTPSSPTPSDHPVIKQTVKKRTRQWAAWTRQEEESFFNALRQVGKNFEMITSRVKSKNKDQLLLQRLPKSHWF